MIEKVKDVIFPVGGGSLGSIIASISFIKIWEVMIFAFIGAAIGWFTKLGLDYCKKRIKNK